MTVLLISWYVHSLVNISTAAFIVHTVMCTDNKWTPTRNSEESRKQALDSAWSMEMSNLTRDATAEPVSRDQILRRERGQGIIHFPCSAAYHEQDWQPCPVVRVIHTNIVLHNTHTAVVTHIYVHIIQQWTWYIPIKTAVLGTSTYICTYHGYS